MAQDTSFLVLYVLCNEIVPVRMTICAVLPVRGKEIGTTISSINENTTRNVLSVYCVCIVFSSFTGFCCNEIQICFIHICKFSLLISFSFCYQLK